MIAHGGNTPKVSAAHWVAVYDPTGRVVRMHHVVVFEGAKPISRDEAQKEAIELAGRGGHDVGKLKALVVEGLPVKAGQFRVDVETKKLVAVERPTTRQRGPTNRRDAAR